MHNDATLLLFHVQEMAKKVIDKRSFVHTYNQEYCLVAYSLYQRLPRLFCLAALGVFCTLKTTSARIIHFAEVSIHLCELLDAISDAAAA